MTKATFTQGSTMRHIVVMTLSSTLGLLSLFFVDLVDMYFLSLLGQKELAAAVGFSGTLLFFMTAVSIACSISLGAKVSQALGQQQEGKARELNVNALLFSVCLTSLVTLPTWLYAENLLQFLGAQGTTLVLALDYTSILLPSTPVLALAMGLAAGLRATGDAKRSMLAIMGGGVVNAVLDPILIFTFEMNIAGAAWASVMARFAIFGIALFYILNRHHLLCMPQLTSFKRDFTAIFSVAGPALLTNLATPIGGSYVTKSMAEFGDSAVAGAAIIGRLVPVGFCGLFALSGAVGPIFGQNVGAKAYSRVQQILRDAVYFAGVYVLVVWAIFFFAQDFVVSAFEASGEAENLIKTYSTWIVPGFFFNGLLFAANAAFNNMHAAHLATLFNFARTLLGTVPFVFLFAMYLGPVGVLVGEIAGAVVFGTLAMVTAYLRVPSLKESDKDNNIITAREQEETDSELAGDTCQWPHSSEKSAIGQEVVGRDARG